jgi:hypothetical protein
VKEVKGPKKIAFEGAPSILLAEIEEFVNLKVWRSGNLGKGGFEDAEGSGNREKGTGGMGTSLKH